MKVSIVIINYNYARFLSEAVDSALSQTYSDVEVVVVDDGSTDASRAVIESYGTRVKPVFQTNQGSNVATNAGLSMARGELVIFLDADDKLKPTIVEEVVKKFEIDQGLARVQYFADFIDAGGSNLPVPEWWHGIDWVDGDCRQSLLNGGLLSWPPTSCNAYRRSVIDKIGPVPTHEAFRVCVDLFLCNLSTVFGNVGTVPTSGVSYRVHGSNNFAGSTHRQEVDRILTLANERHRLVFQALAKIMGNPNLELDLLLKHLGTLRAKVALGRVVAGQGPSCWKLAFYGVRASVRSPKLNIFGKALSSAWFVACAVLPRSWATKFVTRYYQSGGYGRISSLVGRSS